jgi:hypothetical protein
MKLGLTAALLVTVFITGGCSTHEAKFEEGLPPPPSRLTADRDRASHAAARLISNQQSRIAELSPEALAPLAQSAALLFGATGAPAMRMAARSFADTLLQAQISVNGGKGFFSSADPRRPDLQTTIAAGDALLDVFNVTGDPRYASAAQDALQAVRSRELGWSRTKNGYAIKVPGRSQYNIPETAAAALLLRRSAKLNIDPAAHAEGTSAFGFVETNQAAVGRWYLNVGAKVPMNLTTWASTLLSLASARDLKYQGIVGAGAPALWSAAFTDTGTPQQIPLVTNRGVGVALALRLFQRYAGTAPDAETAYATVLSHLSSDGSVEWASPGDYVAQAYYALAFAERAFALRRVNQWDNRLA